MDRFNKYHVGDILECTNVTEDNVEGLVLSCYYTVIGSTPMNGGVVYSVRNEETKKVYYSIDRFELLVSYQEVEAMRLDMEEMEKENVLFDMANLGFTVTVDGNNRIKDIQTPTELGQEMGYIFKKGFEDGMANVPDSEFDKVNHPSHYNTYQGFEVIDVIEQVTEGLSGIECVCVGNVIKYMLRYQFKNGVEDLKKARFYLDKVIKILERKGE